MIQKRRTSMKAYLSAADELHSPSPACCLPALGTGCARSMPDSRRQVLAQQSEATEGAALRSAVSARRSASRITLSAAPLLTTSSSTALMPAAQQLNVVPCCQGMSFDSVGCQASITSLSCLISIMLHNPRCESPGAVV